MSLSTNPEWLKATRTDGMENSENNPYFGQILLFQGRGIISRLIRWQTRGKYSHAAIRVSENECVESWAGPGVRLKKISDWTGIDVFDVPIPYRWKVLAVSFAAQQIGKKYDYLGVLRFVSRRKRNSLHRWFCSELVFEAFKHAGCWLFARTEGWEVSPSELARSPVISLSQGTE